MAAAAIFDFINVPFLRCGWAYSHQFGMLVQNDTL